MLSRVNINAALQFVAGAAPVQQADGRPFTTDIPLAGSFRVTSMRDKTNARIVSEFIQNSPTAFDRNTQWGHVTASAFVLSEALDHVLLTHHAKLDCWLPLGGHCDGIRDPRFVALKESYEESGLFHLRQLNNTVFDIDIHTIPAGGGMPDHKHLDIRYLFQADMAAKLRPTIESKALAWVPLDQLATYTKKSSVLILPQKLVTS
jgi:8-oxo-dGTP pyrophosphatase MutT (NUDIX family)